MIKISRIPLSLDSAVKSDPELDRVSASFGEEETKSKIQKSPWNSCNSQIGGKKAKQERVEKMPSFIGFRHARFPLKFPYKHSRAGLLKSTDFRAALFARLS